ncbi:MAG TPA: glycosyltransferase family 2 protein [Pyrinomonadaceae bacterium]|jgi:cellulose synthase/poly-beta-1,6-N-acetylglucosamine synthase-like glycosyltransferase
MLVFYLFAALVVWLGIVSLRGGVRYLAYVRSEMAKEREGFAPFATIIAPCRGLDQGLRENISALFIQQYPAYEIIFVSDSGADPAFAVIEEVRRELEPQSTARARVCVAGEAKACGQKVHNLRAAVLQADSLSELFVFVDTDARPDPYWLSSLVAPLADEGALGAVTGYRWFIPVRGGLASRLRAVWNASIASALGERTGQNFCWGGSTAIRRTTFERLNMMDEWRGALSDDFAMTRALKRAKLPIHFTPCCLTASFDDCSFRELLEFTTRQMKITRVYAPHLWKAALLGSLLFVLVFFGGLSLVIIRAALGLSFVAPLTLLTIIYLLGVWKAYLRLRAVMLALAPHRADLDRDAPAQLLLWPLASAIYLYNTLAAAFSRRIRWRGISYELKSPKETVIIPRVRSEETINATETARRAQ